MARIEYIKQRLENWALWKERESRGGLGFYSQSAFLREVVDCSRQGNSLYSTIDEIEATKTDEAVESLQFGKEQLYRTIDFIYLQDTGIRKAAEYMCKAESTIKANLEKADFEIQVFLRNKAEERERAAAASK